MARSSVVNLIMLAGVSILMTIALGNFLHFAMVAVMLTREAIDHGVIQLATSAAVFGAFAIGFGIVLFRPPVPSRDASSG